MFICPRQVFFFFSLPPASASKCPKCPRTGCFWSKCPRCLRCAVSTVSVRGNGGGDLFPYSVRQSLWNLPFRRVQNQKTQQSLDAIGSDDADRSNWPLPELHGPSRACWSQSRKTSQKPLSWRWRGALQTAVRDCEVLRGHAGQTWGGFCSEAGRGLRVCGALDCVWSADEIFGKSFGVHSNRHTNAFSPGTKTKLMCWSFQLWTSRNGWRVRDSQVTKAQCFLDAGLQHVELLFSKSMCWDIEMDRRDLCRWRRHSVKKCSFAVLHANSFQVLWRSRARSRQRWNEDPKEGLILAVPAEGCASTTQLGNCGALAKRRCPSCRSSLLWQWTQVDDGLSRPGRNQSGAWIASPLQRLQKRKVESWANRNQGNWVFFLALLNRSLFQVLFHCAEESQSIKVCCVVGSRPRGVPRGEVEAARRKDMLVEYWKRFPPFLHADSELTGVSPAISSWSWQKEKVHEHQDATRGAHTDARRDLSSMSQYWHAQNWWRIKIFYGRFFVVMFPLRSIEEIMAVDATDILCWRASWRERWTTSVLFWFVSTSREVASWRRRKFFQCCSFCTDVVNLLSTYTVSSVVLVHDMLNFLVETRRDIDIRSNCDFLNERCNWRSDLHHFVTLRWRAFQVPCSTSGLWVIGAKVSWAGPDPMLRVLVPFRSICDM